MPLVQLASSIDAYLRGDRAARARSVIRIQLQACIDQLSHNRVALRARGGVCRTRLAIR